LVPQSKSQGIIATVLQKIFFISPSFLPRYMPPEMLHQRGYGAGVDWWQFGILLYEMLFAKTPFKVTGGSQVRKHCK